MKPGFIRSVMGLSFVVLATVILTACGGAGGGGSIDVADGGIRGTGSSVGPVSGFGSVFVNGVRFDTGALNGEIQSGDGIAMETELDEGMILRVDGEWRDNGQGIATSIEYDDTLRGPITVITPWDDASRTGVISIQGLRVNMDRQTVFKGILLPADLVNDDLVRVSGWRLNDGEFRASLIRVHSGVSGPFDGDNAIELEGPVTNYIASPCSFEIGNVLVRCDSTSPNLEYENVTPADLSANPVIEVEGNLFSGELIATEIREDDQRRYRLESEGDIEFSGPVSDGFNSNLGSFEMNGITVNVTPKTEFGDDLTAQDLVIGLLVQVEGDYQSDGTINADEIELREANAEVGGRISSSGFDPMAETLTVGGVLVRLTPNTVIKADDDQTGQQRDQLLTLLSQGVGVEVEGIEREGSGGIFLEALKVEINDEESDGGSLSFELEGKLREINDSSLSILGVTMTYVDDALGETSRSELQALIKSDQDQYPGVEIEYEGSSPDPFRATSIDLEDSGSD